MEGKEKRRGEEIRDKGARGGGRGGKERGRGERDGVRGT